MSLREEVTEFLRLHRLHLNTNLGQHFLVDEDALEHIVDSAKITPGEKVVEIGPGIGVLTRELLIAEAKVTAIELDARLIPLLNKFTHENSSLTIINQNALTASLPGVPYKIVANIPYHITSPLLRHVFLESKRTPKSLTLLIQKEVAQTICDKENAGILTILVGLFGDATLVCNVASSAFLPPPAVDSAVLHVECFDEPKADRETIDRVFTLTKVGFGQRRKMLRNTIGNLESGMEHLSSVQIAPTRRPQTLSVDEWIALARAFHG